jgi:hypothetical protein
MLHIVALHWSPAFSISAAFADSLAFDSNTQLFDLTLESAATFFFRSTTSGEEC